MNNADLDTTVVCPCIGAYAWKGWPATGPTLRECLRYHATASLTDCTHCAAGRQRVETAGPAVMARILGDPCSSPTSSPRTNLGVSAQGNHVLFKSLLGEQPQTTAELRKSLVASVGHSRGLTALLEALRLLNLVSVENHGDKECRETWTWRGFDTPLNRRPRRPPPTRREDGELLF